MRYIIIVYPFHLAAPISTDFKLMALLIGFCRRLVFPAVQAFDTETGERIYSYCRSGKRRLETLPLDVSSER